MHPTNKQDPYEQELRDEHYTACKMSSSSFLCKNPEVTSSWSCTWSAKLKLALIFKLTFINYFQVCQAVNDQYTLCTLRNNVQEFSYRKLGQSNGPPRRWSHSKKCELLQVRLASAACACRTCWQPTKAVDACVVASIWAWCSVCVYLHLVSCTSTVQIHRKRDDLFLPVFLQAPCMKVVPKFCCWC